MQDHRPLMASALVFICAACSSSNGAEGPPTSVTDAGPGAGDVRALDTQAPEARAREAESADAGSPVVVGVLVVGALAGSDLSVSKKEHDALAKGGQSIATSAGDVGHTVTLGTTLLGTTEDQYLSLDQWTNDTAQKAFYSNPTFKAGFAKVFSAPPSLVIFDAQPTWAGYGNLDSANTTDPHYWVVVRGKFASSDLATNKAAHDKLVAQAGPGVRAAGDLAHVVWTQHEDAQQYMSIDVWADPTNITATYTNPQLQMAFGALFADPPTIGVYQSTDWYQW